MFRAISLGTCEKEDRHGDHHNCVYLHPLRAWVYGRVARPRGLSRGYSGFKPTAHHTKCLPPPTPMFSPLSSSIRRPPITLFAHEDVMNIPSPPTTFLTPALGQAVRGGRKRRGGQHRRGAVHVPRASEATAAPEKIKGFSDERWCCEDSDDCGVVGGGRGEKKRRSRGAGRGGAR